MKAIQEAAPPEDISTKSAGRVASLHLHPAELIAPMLQVERIAVVEGKGASGSKRHFAGRSRSGGFSKRQLSLIEREQIAAHAHGIGWPRIDPGVVRSNIETEGVNLISLIGRKVRIGTAEVFFYEPRTPCYKMDKIKEGLCDLMKNQKQGVLAQVIKSGIISVGDALYPFKDEEANGAVEKCDTGENKSARR